MKTNTTERGQENIKKHCEFKTNARLQKTSRADTSHSFPPKNISQFGQLAYPRHNVSCKIIKGKIKKRQEISHSKYSQNYHWKYLHNIPFGYFDLFKGAPLSNKVF